MQLRLGGPVDTASFAPAVPGWTVLYAADETGQQTVAVPIAGWMSIVTQGKPDLVPIEVTPDGEAVDPRTHRHFVAIVGPGAEHIAEPALARWRDRRRTAR